MSSSTSSRTSWGGVRADLVLQFVRSLPEGCGVTLLGDPCQAIYDYQVRGARETTFDDLQRVLDATRVFETVTLSVNHRSGGICSGWLERDLAELRAAILRGDAASSGVGAAIAMEDVAARSPMREWVRPVIDLPGKDLGEWRVGVIARTNRKAMRAFQGLARYHDVPTRLRLADKDLYDGRVDRREHENEPSRQERKRLGEASIAVYTVHRTRELVRGYLDKASQHRDLTGFLSQLVWAFRMLDYRGIELDHRRACKHALAMLDLPAATRHGRSYNVQLWSDSLIAQMEVRGRVEDRYLRDSHALMAELEHERELRSHEASDSAITARAEALSGNSYESDGYLIRSAASVQEILDEANAQSNCVASFIDKYAAGRTDLWLMRDADDPDTPLVTVEVRDGVVRQAFQSHNRQITAS